MHRDLPIKGRYATLITTNMNSDTDKDLLYSQSVKAGKRIYYFDVKQSRNGDKYVAITESKRISDGPADNPHVTYEKHKLFLYKEDYEKFLNALQNVIEVASTGVVPQPEEPVEEPQAQQNGENSDFSLGSFDMQL